MVQVLLGTYTAQSHIVEVSAPPGQPLSISLVSDIAVPRASWWTRHPVHSDIWYAALEADDDGGARLGVEGAVGVYRFTGGTCEELGRVSAVDNPCHVAVVAGGRGLAVANYTGGSALLLPLDANGTFTKGANNYIHFPQLGDRPSMGHQCRDMPQLNECWIVDTGNACIQRMTIDKDALEWTLQSHIPTAAGEGPRQIWTSPDGKHLYTLNARSCTVTHHYDGSLVSAHNILPEPHKIDINARIGPPFTTAAALSFHSPSRTLIATSRLIQGEDVDSVAFLKIGEDGNITGKDIMRPRRGREYRGVGIVGDLLFVAGQQDGWLSCFRWDGSWSELSVPDSAYFREVIDIQEM